MSKVIRALVPAAFVSISLLNAPAGAAEGKAVDLTAFLCKDIMRASGEERAVTIGALHGYMLGKTGATTFDPDHLADVSNEFVEYCLDNPLEKAMASFEKLAR